MVLAEVYDISTFISILGSDKLLADSLSRNNAHFFLLQVPQASHYPSRISPPLIQLLECNFTWTTTAVQGYFAAALAPSTHST